MLCYEARVWVTFSSSNLYDMINAVIEISNAGAGVAGNASLVCMTVYALVWGNGGTRYRLTQH